MSSKEQGETVFSANFSDEEKALIKSGATIKLTENGTEKTKVKMEKEFEEDFISQKSYFEDEEKIVKRYTSKKTGKKIEQEFIETDKKTGEQKIVKKKVPEMINVEEDVKKTVKVEKIKDVTEKRMVKRIVEEEIEIKKYSFEIIQDQAVIESLIKGEISKVSKIFDNRIAKFLEVYPNYEVSTFETQRAEAENFLNSGKSKYLEKLLESKNHARTVNALQEISLQDFAEKIIEKSEEFLSIYGDLIQWKEAEVLKIKKKYNLV